MRRTKIRRKKASNSPPKKKKKKKKGRVMGYNASEIPLRMHKKKDH